MRLKTRNGLPLQVAQIATWGSQSQSIPVLSGSKLIRNPYPDCQIAGLRIGRFTDWKDSMIVVEITKWMQLRPLVALVLSSCTPLLIHGLKRITECSRSTECVGLFLRIGRATIFQQASCTFRVDHCCDMFSWEGKPQWGATLSQRALPDLLGGRARAEGPGYTRLLEVYWDNGK